MKASVQKIEVQADDCVHALSAGERDDVVVCGVARYRRHWLGIVSDRRVSPDTLDVLSGLCWGDVPAKLRSRENLFQFCKKPWA